MVGGGPVAQMVVRWISQSNVAVIAMLLRAEQLIGACKNGGAHVVLEGSTDSHCRQSVEKAMGRVPDVIIDCTSDASVLEWGLSVVETHGRIVLLGDPSAPNERHLTSDVLLRGIAVVGTHDRCTYHRRWTDKKVATIFFRLLSSGKFNLEGLCSSEFNITSARSAYSLLSSTRGLLGLRLRWGEDSFS